MRKLLVMTILAVLGSFSLGSGAARAASYERCIQGYNYVNSAAYVQRLQRDGAACEGYADKYGADDDDKLMNDPCYGGPPICRESMGIGQTRYECGEVASSNLGSPEQVGEAERIYQELKENAVCPYAQ